jgi:hypothetical protein
VLLVVYGDDDDLEPLARTREVLSKFYVVTQIRISYPYDERESLKIFAHEKRVHHFGDDVSFDFYLLHRNGPYTPEDLRNLRRLGVTKTPTYMILDKEGQTLWASQIKGDLDADLLRKFSMP